MSNGKMRFNALVLQQKRIQLGLTFEELAARVSTAINETAESKVSVGVATVWRWEGGRSQPRKRYIPALCRVLRVTSDELFRRR